jgi:hypothetical protein
LRNYFRNRSDVRKKHLEDQRKANENYRKGHEKDKQKSNEPTSSEIKEERDENLDQSVYGSDNPEATQEDDMEEDLALLDDYDMGWLFDLC